MVTYSSWVTIFWSIFHACCTSVHPFFTGFEAEKGMRVIHACVVYTLFYGIYKAHIWYEGTSHRYTLGGTKVKAICQGQGQNLRTHFPRNGSFGGHYCFTNTACFQFYTTFTEG